MTRGIVVAVLLLPTVVFAHGVQTEVSSGPAVIVTVTHDDGTPLALADAVIRAPGEETPFLGSRTDRHGRITFLPDRAGQWRVTVATADGHGADLMVTVDEDLLVIPTTTGQASASRKVLTGVVVLLAAFGALALLVRRK